MLCRFVSLHICIISNILFRGQLKSESMCRQLAQQKAAQRTQEEEAAALRVTEIIKAKVEEVMASEATQQRIQRRLKEERASLEDKVNCWSCMGLWCCCSGINCVKHAYFNMHFTFPSVHISHASLNVLRTRNHGMRAHYQPDS